jgi:hypothetical protein
MPDRWGRVTADDWNQTTNMLTGMTGALNNASQARERRDVKQNFAAIQQNPDDPQYTGSEFSQAQARSAHAQDLKTQESILSSQDQAKYRTMRDNVMGWIQKNPGLKVPDEMYSGVMGQQLMYDLGKLELSNQQVQSAIYTQIKAESDKLYKDVFLPMRSQISADLSSGKVPEAAVGIQNLWRQVATRAPYDLVEYDPQTQSFQKLYNDSQSDGLKPVGNVSLSDAMAMISETGPKEFYLQRATHMAAVREGNEENRLPENLGYATGPKGNQYLVIRQRRLDDPMTLNLEVRDIKTNNKIMFDSYSALQDAGFKMEDLKHQKAQSETDKASVDYQTAIKDDKRKDVNFYNDQQKFNDTQLKGIITTAVNYFTNPQEDALTNVTAILGGNTASLPKNAAYTRALEFYEDNKTDSDSLTGVDAEKFKIAESFIGATRAYFASRGKSQQTQQKSNTTAYVGSKPPQNHPNAKKAKDGKWYIRENDKWKVVLQD